MDEATKELIRSILDKALVEMTVREVIMLANALDNASDEDFAELGLPRP